MPSSRTSSWYPIAAMLLLSAYPVGAMLASNLDQVYAEVIVRPLLLSTGAVVVLFACAWLLLGSSHRAALLSAWSVLLFSSYGHVYELARNDAFLGGDLGRHRYLTPIWLVILVVGVWALVRVRRPDRLTPGLTVFLAIALAGPVLGILARTSELAWRPPTTGDPQGAAGAEGMIQDGGGSPSPDIYYIILDGYGRQQTLLDVIGFDNQEILDDLERLGFVVADCSLANYNHTDTSLASSMNFDYLENLHVLPDPDSDDRSWLPDLIQHSRLRQFLEDRGYATIAFETEYRSTELRDADRFLGFSGVGGSQGVALGFERMFLRSTWLRLYYDTLGKLVASAGASTATPQGWRRANVLNTLDTLEHLPGVRGPKFVFAHVISPHVPYVFGKDGEPVEQPDPDTEQPVDWQRQAYAAQAQYIGSRVVEIARILIEESSYPPVIVIQGDHGPDLETTVGTLEDQLGILNAYFFPGAESTVYDSITPVNSFRLVLNAVFKTQLAPVVDASFYSTEGDPFWFQAVTNSCVD